MCHRYHAGVKYVAQMEEHWRSLQPRIDPVVFRLVGETLAQHYRDAGIWRDTCLTYFQRFSGKPIVGDD
ncbi:MAG: hypothetical protein A2X66_07590 [Ignavibacteria bacterium GWA2_54_16]|nr:MAG: hypothetical protein A2X66_07590 [Ignavibacteria bacterium GWA2_54_16]